MVLVRNRPGFYVNVTCFYICRPLVEDFSKGVGGGWKRTHDPNETTILNGGIPFNRYFAWRTWADIDPLNETMNR